jgi:hypothetical protein
MNLSPRFFVPAVCLAALCVTGCNNQTVTVRKLGGGQGIVTGLNADCGQSVSTCSSSFAAGPVTLTSGQMVGANVFTGWAGACENLGTAAYPPSRTDCSLHVADGPLNVYVGFLSAAPPVNPATNQVVTHRLTFSTMGGGSVTSSPLQAGGCGPTCMVFPEGVPVTLTATPPQGSAFTSWTGCDAVDGVSGASAGFCTFILTGDRTVTAAFSTLEGIAVSVSSDDGGAGTINLDTPSTPSFNCHGGNGTVCHASLTSGTAFTFRATTDIFSTFGGWDGCPGTVAQVSAFVFTCSGTVGSAALNLSAKFIGSFPLTVTKTGNGAGTVKAYVVPGPPAVPNPLAAPDIDCGFTNCSSQTGKFRSGDWVFISAVGAPFNHNAGWGGACMGTIGDVCYVQMSRAAASVSVTFNRP